jgi:hypothetical protein
MQVENVHVAAHAADTHHNTCASSKGTPCSEPALSSSAIGYTPSMRCSGHLPRLQQHPSFSTLAVAPTPMIGVGKASAPAQREEKGPRCDVDEQGPLISERGRKLSGEGGGWHVGSAHKWDRLIAVFRATIVQPNDYQLFYSSQLIATFLQPIAHYSYFRSHQLNQTWP